MIKIGYFAQFDIRVSTTFIYDLLQGLQQSDTIELECYNGGLKKKASLNSKSIGYSAKNLKWLHRYSRLAFLFGKSNPELLIKAKQKQANKILNTHVGGSIDVAYVEFATTAVILMEFFSSNRIPFVVHVHGYDITTQINDEAYHQEVLRLFQLADQFIAASEYMKRRLILLGCPESKIKVIRLGVGDERVKIVDWEERKLQAPSVIFLGRLTPKKNPLALLHAFYLVNKAIPESRLTIIGDGPLRNEVESLIEKLQLNEVVKLHGALDREKSFPILRSHWVCAQHSVTPISGDTEGFAISLAEAALHEIPVVSTIHNGIPENVIDGQSGFLVPEYDYPEMANKIIELLQNPEMAEKMGKRGRESVLKRNNQEVRVKKVEELLNDVYSKSKKGFENG